MSPILSRRYCRRGHELIAGTTAYVVTRWTGREVFLPQSGGLLEACAGGPVNGTPCKHGGPEMHHRLEGALGAGGTRVVGTTEDGRTLWQHRTLELRCRRCNRARVAAHRAKQVIGGGGATDYAESPRR